MSQDDVLRDVYEDIQMFKELCKIGGPKGGANRIAEFMKEQRRKISQINRYSTDPLEKSMRDEWRHICSEDGEGGYDYRILADGGETEDEIREMCKAAVGYPPICSPYDCTGKRFTRWITVHRVPVGFVVIHSWGLDV